MTFPNLGPLRDHNCFENSSAMSVLEPSSDEPLIGPEAPAMAGSAPVRFGSFASFWSKRAVMSRQARASDLGPALPVFTYKQTSSDRSGRSCSCHQQTHAPQ